MIESYFNVKEYIAKEDFKNSGKSFYNMLDAKQKKDFIQRNATEWSRELLCYFIEERYKTEGIIFTIDGFGSLSWVEN